MTMALCKADELYLLMHGKKGTKKSWWNGRWTRMRSEATSEATSGATGKYCTVFLR